MKSLITLTIIFTVLGIADPSFADQEVFGVAFEENDTATQPLKRAIGSYAETERMGLFTSQYGTADVKYGGAESVMEIKLLPDREATYNLMGLRLFENHTGTSDYDVSSVYVVVPEYKSKSVTAGDILRKVPSVSSEDEKTIGILVPPFGYFAKKF